jgi:predicted GNAT family acetyltransferase
MSALIDNRALSRFELPTGAGPAFAEYRLADGVLTIFHTEVPEEVREQGIGSQLAHAVLEEARARGLKVVARCPFVAAYLRRHPEFSGLAA